MPTSGRFEDQARDGSSGIPASPSERQKTASAIGPRRSGWSLGSHHCRLAACPRGVLFKCSKCQSWPPSVPRPSRNSTVGVGSGSRALNSTDHFSPKHHFNSRWQGTNDTDDLEKSSRGRWRVGPLGGAQKKPLQMQQTLHPESGLWTPDSNQGLSPTQPVLSPAPSSAPSLESQPCSSGSDLPRASQTRT